LSGQIDADAAVSTDAPAMVAGLGKRSEAPSPAVRIRHFSATAMVDEVVINGRTEAFRTVQLRAEIRGPVEQVLAERGLPVKAGDPILRIAVNDRQAALAEANAKLAQRQIEFEAARQLGQKGFQSDIKVAEGRAALDAARAAAVKAELDVFKTTVSAPFDGILAEREAEIGSYLDAGNKAATIVDLDPIRLVGQVSERDIGNVRVGARGFARLLSGEEVEGRIAYVASGADPATRTFRVEMTVPNPDLRIRDGLTARIRLPGKPRLAHLVPLSVLTLADDGRVGLKLVDEADHVRFHPVRTLGEAAGGVWLDGLPEHIRVIVAGQEFVTEAQAVRPALDTAWIR
jgi:multidrug efflux system membrane fusion protein